MRSVSAILWVVGAAFILVGTGFYVYDRWGPVPRTMPEIQSIAVPIIKEATATPVAVSTATPTVDELVSNFRRILATPDPFIWNDIRLLDRTRATMIFQVPGGGIRTEPFEIHRWFPEIMDSGIFDPGNGTAVSMQDDDNHYALWLHSGYRQTMTPIQNWIERDDSGRLVPAEDVDLRLDSMIGSDVYFEQEVGVLSFATIIAAVRIPPGDVDDTSVHVMDLIPYLAEHYPGHGFAEVNGQVLYLYFCGRALPDESPNPKADKWTQARFVLVLVPYQNRFDLNGIIE